MATGISFSCGVTTDDTALCWGGQYGEGTERGGQFRELNIDGTNVCGLRADWNVICWASHLAVETVRSNYPFKSLSTGKANHGCGILTGGSVVCWPGPDVAASWVFCHCFNQLLSARRILGITGTPAGF